MRLKRICGPLRCLGCDAEILPCAEGGPYDCSDPTVYVTGVPAHE
jgi:hypothetical protein